MYHVGNMTFPDIQSARAYDYETNGTIDNVRAGPAPGGMLTGGDNSEGSQTPVESFTLFRGVELGDANPDALYNRADSTQVTVEGLKEYFNSEGSAMLRQAFGDFDNYLAYMTERERLIQSGDYDVGSWTDYSGALTPEEIMILEGEDLTQYGDDASSTYEELYRRRTQEQASAYDRWVNSEANQVLLAKYGVGSTIFNDDGDRYEWNGSAYVKTMKVDDHLGMGDIVKAIGALAVAAGVGGALSGKLASLLGSTGGAAATGAVQSAIVQGITTGSVDLGDMLVAAATAGLTEQFNTFLEESGLGGNSSDYYIKKSQELAAEAAELGENSPFYQALSNASARYAELGELVKTGITSDYSDIIINLAGQTGQLNDVLRNMQDNLNEYEDVAWQDVDVSDALGNIQVSLRDYAENLRRLQEEREGGGGGGSFQPNDDPNTNPRLESGGFAAPTSNTTYQVGNQYFDNIQDARAYDYATSQTVDNVRAFDPSEFQEGGVDEEYDFDQDIVRGPRATRRRRRKRRRHC